MTITAREIDLLNRMNSTSAATQLGTLIQNAESVTAGEIALAQGSILVGNASGVGAALDASASTKILIGNGTTAAAFALSGDVTMTNGGVVTIGEVNHATNFIVTSAGDAAIRSIKGQAKSGTAVAAVGDLVGVYGVATFEDGTGTMGASKTMAGGLFWTELLDTNVVFSSGGIFAGIRNIVEVVQDLDSIAGGGESALIYHQAYNNATGGNLDYGVYVGNNMDTANKIIGTAFHAYSATGASFNYGIDFSTSTINTADIVLQNGEYIKNTTDGLIEVSGKIQGAITSTGSTALRAAKFQAKSGTAVASVGDLIGVYGVSTFENGTGTMAAGKTMAGGLFWTELLDTDVVFSTGGIFAGIRNIVEVVQDLDSIAGGGESALAYHQAYNNATGGNLDYGVYVGNNMDAANKIIGTAFHAYSATGASFNYGLDLAQSTINTADIRLSSGASIYSGTGTPSYSATQGSIYIRTGQAANASLYLNTDGATTWTLLDKLV